MQSDILGPGGEQSQVVLATADDVLLDDLLRLCAAADATPVVATDPAAARRWWPMAALVVVGDDLAAYLEPPPLRRSGVVVVARDEAAPSLYQHGVSLGAEQVITLRDDEAWLIDQMGLAGDGRARAVVVAVVGARGGAGASTLCAAVGLHAVTEHLSCVVVDADPRGGDLDLLLDVADEPGLRWDDLAQASGRLPASPLAHALPRRDGLALLCARHCGPVPAGAIGAVLGALARGFDLVLVDVPHWHAQSGSPALTLADVVLVATTADLRGVASARRVVSDLDDHGPPVRLVVRTGRSGSADPDQVSRWLGVPLAARLPYDAKICADGDRGDLVVRASLRRASRAVLSDVAEVAGRPAAGVHA